MNTEKRFDPVEAIGGGMTDSTRVLNPVFSALYPREAIDMLKDQIRLTVIRKSLSIYSRMHNKVAFAKSRRISWV
jgi:hypothetical protein